MCQTSNLWQIHLGEISVLRGLNLAGILLAPFGGWSLFVRIGEQDFGTGNEVLPLAMVFVLSLALGFIAILFVFKVYRFSLVLDLGGLYFGNRFPYSYARWFDVYSCRNWKRSWPKMSVPNGVTFFVRTSEADLAWLGSIVRASMQRHQAQ